MILIEVPNYPVNIEISKTRKAQYYEWKGNTIRSKTRKLPKMYHTSNTDVVTNQDLKHPYYLAYKVKSKWIAFRHDVPTVILNSKKEKVVLINIEEEEPIVANAGVKDTPRYASINMNTYYSGNISPHTRVKMMDMLHELFINALNNTQHSTVMIAPPVITTIRFYTQFGLNNWDIENIGWPYMKAFNDVIKRRLIPDDNVSNLCETRYKFCPIGMNDTRRIVITVETDVKNLNNPHFKSINNERNSL